MQNKTEKIKKLQEKVVKWDILARDNKNNKHNLSTSERQDWLDKIDELKRK